MHLERTSSDTYEIADRPFVFSGSGAGSLSPFKSWSIHAVQPTLGMQDALRGCYELLMRLKAMRMFAAVLFALAVCSAAAQSVPQQGPATYTVGTRPRAVAVGYLNADRHLDAAVANVGDGTVSILIGIPGGRFRPAALTVQAGREPAHLDTVDLDKDGDLDLVIANHETSRVTVLLNDGNAGFESAADSPMDTGARPHVHGVATGDFNGDGWPDVAVESADTKEVRVLTGGPTGFAGTVVVPVRTMPYSRLGTGDLDGDGVPEVLVPGHKDNTVRIVHRAGREVVLAPTMIKLRDQPWMVVAADINGDKRKDIVVVHSNAVTVWFAGRDGFSARASAEMSVPGATEVATGDLDGDGFTDIAVGPWESDEISVFTGPKLTAAKVRACERPVGLAIADLNGDGRGEILAACATGSRLVVVGLTRK
ncbi:MAG TPA: VCBS repeat-containing protein [Bryobacteraceae bacterium]|nr:VCBS repeat-containing protein [Bryobacteraceae bacterium]